MAIFLKVKRIVAIGDKVRFAELASQALKLSYVEISEDKDFTPQLNDFLILNNTFIDEVYVSIIIKKSIEKYNPIFAINPSKHIREILELPLKKGLLLKDKKCFVLIPRQEMVYVVYDMNLTPRK